MSLESFFDPQSVAVVGASGRKGEVGHEILTGLVRGGYAGKILPIDPEGDEIEGLKCYPALESLGTAPDLVIIAIPASA